MNGTSFRVFSLAYVPADFSDQSPSYNSPAIFRIRLTVASGVNPTISPNSDFYRQLSSNPATKDAALVLSYVKYSTSLRAYDITYVPPLVSPPHCAWSATPSCAALHRVGR